MAQIAQYALEVSIKVDNICVTATVNDDKTTLYDGPADDLAAEQKEALVSLFTIHDQVEADESGTQLPREATFHAKFFAPEGMSLDVPGFVKAALEYCSADEDDDDTDKDGDKDALAMCGAPPMSGLPRGGMHGRGGFRGLSGGRGGMPGTIGRGGMGPGGMGPGGMGPGGMQGPGGMGPGGMGPGGMVPGGMGRGGMPGFPHGFPGHQGPSAASGPHGPDGPHGSLHGHEIPFAPGAPFGGVRRMPGQWQYRGKSKHGLIALTMDIREI
ncbi:hypothetical protein GGF32_000848 [Allomyces javanicus]|nr:hypothetical protein GGF32_000848 [Allomyces javanicus]